MTITQAQFNAVLAIFFQSRFITKIAESVDIARQYYNARKNYCLSLNLVAIDGLSGRVTFTLDDIVRIVNNGPVNQNESIFFFYYKHRNVLIRLLGNSKRALDNKVEGKSFCHNVKLPSELYYGLSDPTFTMDSSDYAAISDALRVYRLSSNNSLQLPTPSVTSSSQTMPNLLPSTFSNQ